MSNNCSAVTPEERLTIVTVQTALYVAAFVTSALLFITSACVRFGKRISIERTETHFVAIGCILLLYSLVSSFHWVAFYEDTSNAVAGCTAVAILSQYSLLSLLVATTCIGAHLLLLLCQPKFLRVIDEQKRHRYKHLEFLYIGLIISLPLAFLPWPFLKNLYGRTGHLCWIKARESDRHNCNVTIQILPGFLEQIVLYYLWSFLVFGFTIFVTLFIMILICRRTRKGNANIYTLLFYLVTFVAANVIGLFIRIYTWFTYSSHIYTLELVQSIVFPLRTVFIAAVLLTRVCYVCRTSRREYKKLIHLN